ncbi:MAG: hypothetical protein HY203_10830 [Nitrospirae bacterium]|nr:hypothetical protein [Nitrospirota bacterium]
MRSSLDWKQKLNEIGGNVDFVRWLAEDQHMLNPLTLPFVTGHGKEAKNRKEANYKKMKRHLMKKEGKRWKDIWKQLYLRGLKQLGKMEYYTEQIMDDTGKFISIPRLDKRVQKVRTKPPATQWTFVWILQAYFKRLTRKPCWSLIADILNDFGGGDKWSHDNVNIGWRYNKKKFEIWNEDVFLDSALDLYRMDIETSSGSYPTTSGQCS